ncbi:uncharacterized protein GGS25DRAFT_489096 [Hypoxylon fragiforme]|uniref:uncharacterized protein n=1 Tax=Hypoxylon fragiforme TaxID=63214 RepID=UPI0020C6A321|nr:uncharacterized protein GGS25DRAFT_489096 [Hypoxylon fragiforme]KAI2608155.1 hypothetical protein GGS25DRAFT_489096 [Hypoxylon fragiforme]
MFNAMTIYYTDDDEWEPRRCRISMPDGRTKNLNTWAPFIVGSQALAQFTHHEIGLRTLIARCMADHRDDRPSLRELLDTVRQNIARGDAEAAEEKRKWDRAKARDPSVRKPRIDIKRPPKVEEDELLLKFFQEYLRDAPIRQDFYAGQWDR